jgi:hypothetical protein
MDIAASVMGSELLDKITRAFSTRLKPAQVRLEDRTQVDEDVEEVLWFSGRDWHDLTWRDWHEHSCALYFFDPEAFAYYLPSLLIVSAQNTNEWLQAADALINLLDQSQDPECWTNALQRFFLILGGDELDAIKDWLLQVCEYDCYKGFGLSGSGPGERLGRAFDTVDLLQREVERRRPQKNSDQ